MMTQLEIDSMHSNMISLEKISHELEIIRKLKMIELSNTLGVSAEDIKKILKNI